MGLTWMIEDDEIRAREKGINDSQRRPGRKRGGGATFVHHVRFSVHFSPATIDQANSTDKKKEKIDAYPLHIDSFAI